jgi:hypothetical protein
MYVAQAGSQGERLSTPDPVQQVPVAVKLVQHHELGDAGPRP